MSIRSTTGIWLVRLLVLGVSLHVLVDLMRQFHAGAITMGHGEFNDRIVVTSAFSRILALLMWGPFLAGLLLAAIRPRLFWQYRWLAPALLIAAGGFYVVFSLLGDYTLE